MDLTMMLYNKASMFPGDFEDQPAVPARRRVAAPPRKNTEAESSSHAGSPSVLRGRSLKVRLPLLSQKLGQMGRAFGSSSSSRGSEATGSLMRSISSNTLGGEMPANCAPRGLWGSLRAARSRKSGRETKQLQISAPILSTPAAAEDTSSTDTDSSTSANIYTATATTMQRATPTMVMISAPPGYSVDIAGGTDAERYQAQLECEGLVQSIGGKICMIPFRPFGFHCDMREATARLPFKNGDAITDHTIANIFPCAPPGPTTAPEWDPLALNPPDMLDTPDTTEEDIIFLPPVPRKDFDVDTNLRKQRISTGRPLSDIPEEPSIRDNSSSPVSEETVTKEQQLQVQKTETCSQALEEEEDFADFDELARKLGIFHEGSPALDDPADHDNVSRSYLRDVDTIMKRRASTFMESQKNKRLPQKVSLVRSLGALGASSSTSPAPAPQVPFERAALTVPTARPESQSQMSFTEEERLFILQADRALGLYEEPSTMSLIGGAPAQESPSPKRDPYPEELPEHEEPHRLGKPFRVLGIDGADWSPGMVLAPVTPDGRSSKSSGSSVHPHLAVQPTVPPPKRTTTPIARMSKKLKKAKEERRLKELRQANMVRSGEDGLF